ncbi:gap junction protein delta 6 [Tachysurus fulvidraco]|uniref:gap junction protein delta 6 n=1 Tax=Tachysurus fulvidraco TaxID=1234273 RepID=UPI001FEE1490|nr:gap junction protein delta 6 [Tachysurus fulvidraco]
MTEWTLLKRLLDAVHQHSTLIGRIWLTVMAIFRLLVVAVAAEDLYADERTMFVCDTLQPGCANVCYDAFAPISQPRFWVFHIIAVSTPSLFFILYTWHNLSKMVPGQNIEDCVRNCNSESCSITSRYHPRDKVADVLEKSARVSPNRRALVQKHISLTRGSSGVLSKAYVLHVCFRAALELAFLSLQWLLFGFCVPVRFTCAVPPCPQRVDCYVSRPTEKSIFLIFMFSVGVFCILLNFLELNHLGWKKIRRSMQVKEGWRSNTYGAINENVRSGTSSTTSLPTLELLVENQPKWTCAGNECCSPLKQENKKSEKSLQKERNDATQVLREKTQTHKARASKRSAEVWI